MCVLGFLPFKELSLIQFPGIYCVFYFNYAENQIHTFSADIDKGQYDERDIEKYHSDDKYVASFIRSFETLQDACDHLHECFKFRKDFQMNGKFIIDIYMG